MNFEELICEQDAAFLSGNSRSPAEFIRHSPVVLTADQRRELIRRDLLHRTKTGQSVSVEDYLPEFSDDASWIQNLLDASTHDSADETGSQPSDPEAPTELGKSLGSSLGSELSGSGRTSSPGGVLKRLKPGTVFGSYDLIEVLGKGGMGIVFKARHRTMGRIVALKVVAVTAGKDDTARQRFRREAKAAARLQHSNIVAAYDADEFDNIPYLALEYVAGPNLSDLVKSRGPFPLADAVRHITDAARALTYAHSRGVIHRDIKPSNILLDSQTDSVKLLDLGLSRVEALLDEASRATELTSTGAMFGTVDFMPPEQARDAKRADERSDIYSLGCTLFFLLTGKMTYGGESILHKIRQHREGPIPRLSESCSDMPKRLEATFSRMVAKNPEDRYQSMQEVVSALEECAATLEGTLEDLEFLPDVTVIGYRPPADSARKANAAVRPPTKRRGWLVAAGLTAVAALGIVALMFLPPTPSDGTPEVVNNKPTAPEVIDESPVEDEIVEPSQPLEWSWPEGFPPPAAAPFDAAQSQQHVAAWAKKLGLPAELTNSLGMKLTLIPPGEFDRGSPGDIFGLAAPGNAAGWIEDSRPVKRVRVTYPLRLGLHEVTHEQFQQFVEATGYQTEAERTGNAHVLLPDGTFKLEKGFSWRKPGEREPDPAEPVTLVTWSDAQVFCGWLSRKEGTSYRLPTEAEWEFACRAGSTLRFGVADQPDQIEPFAWADEGGHRPIDKRHLAPHVAGQKQPNVLGLYDMQGNVWEMCHDSYDATFYSRAPFNNPATPGNGICAIRGGSFFEAYATSNPATRAPFPSAGVHVGFRVVQELPIPPELQTALVPQLVTSDSALSARATVQTPAPIAGLRSWSVELAGFRAGIGSVAYSKAARLVAVSSNSDPHIRLYDEQLGLKKLLVGTQGNPGNGLAPCLAWSPDGALLATVDWGDIRGNGLRIWDVKSGAMLLYRTGMGSWTPSVAWSPDGNQVAIGGGNVWLLDVRTGLSRLLSGGYGQWLAWAPDGWRIAVGDNSALVTIYDSTSLQVLQALTASKAEVRMPFAWSPDGKQFVTGSTKANEAFLLDGETLAFQKSLTLPQTASMFLWTGDASRLVIGGPQTIAWDLKEDKAASTISVGGAIDWLKADESVVIGRNDGLLEVRSIAGLPQARTQDRGRPRPLQAALRLDGQEIAVVRDTDLQFFEAETGKTLEKLPKVIKAGAMISWAPTGDRLASAYDKELAILDRKTGNPIATATGHEGPITAHRWSDDGSRVATASQDKTVRVWNSTDAAETGKFAFEEPVLDAAWSHSGQTLAVALKREIVLLTTDAKEILSRHLLPADFLSGDSGQHGLSWSADDLLVTCCSYTQPLFILDVAAGKVVPFHRDLPGINSRGMMAWSPDGATLLGNADYNEAFLYDRSTRISHRLGYTFRPQWLPDSRRLLSDGFGSLELWGIDAQTSLVTGTLYPALSVGDQPLVISSEGHFRGPAQSVLHVAQTESGSLLTLTASQFEKRFGWKNDPDKATLLRLPPNSPEPSQQIEAVETDEEVFGLLEEPQWRSIDLPADSVRESSRSVSAMALVSRPAPIAGLRNWTIETEGHRGVVDCITYAPTGKLIATGGEDGTIRLWDGTGRLRRVLAGSFNEVGSLEWSRDGRYLASSHGSILRLWNVKEGRLLRTVQLASAVSSISWASDASRLAVGINGRWGVLDARTGQIDEFLSAGGRLTWSPDGERIASGEGLGITIWDAQRLVPLHNWTVPPDITGLGALSWSPDGKWLVGSFGWNLTRIGLWDATTGQYVGDFDPRSSVTYRLHFSRDGQRVCNGFHVWDVASRRAVASCPGSDKRNSLSPEGTQVAVMTGSRLTIRDLLTGATVAESPESIGSMPSVDLAMDGQTLSVPDGLGLDLMDATDGTAKDEWVSPGLSLQALVPDLHGDVLAAKSENNLTLLYRDRRPAKPLIGHTDYISELAWSPDGKLLATAGRDGTLRIWNPDQDQPLHTFDHQKKWVTGIAWSADGQRVATIAHTEQLLRIWNLSTDSMETELGKLTGISPGGNLAWHPDGKSFLIGRPSLPALVMDATTGTTREVNPVGARALWSPDGTQFALSAGVGRIGSADFLRFPGDQTDRRFLVDWFPDSQRLVFAGAGAIRVYSTRHNRPLGALLPSLARGNRLIVGPDGHYRSYPSSQVAIMYVGETDEGQQVVLPPSEFEQRFGWKNSADLARLADLSTEPDPDLVPQIERYEEDRAAALTVLSQRGRVRVRVFGTELEVAKAELLPESPFEVVGVYFYQHPIANDDLAYLKTLKSLRELSLWSCPRITNGILDTIGEHSELRRLELHYTAVTDAGLMALPRFSRLEQLQLDGLPVTEAIAPVLTQLQRLSFLQMGGPELGDATIHELATLPSLTSLVLTCPKATDAAAADFAKMQGLRALQWSGPVGAEVLKALGSLPSLASISFTSGKATDSAATDLGQMPALRTLAMNAAALSDAALRRIGEFPVLDSLTLYNSSLTDAGLGELLRSPTLKTLGLHTASNLTAEAYDSLAASSVESLTLSGVTVNDESLRQMLRSPKLKVLSFHGAPAITGAGFDAASESRLETLQIQGSMFVPENADRLAALKDLQTVIAEEPLLSVMIPGLEQLPLLRTVQCLSAKSLATVGRLKQVTYLYLYDASLLPPGEYQYLAGMERLDQLRVLSADFTAEHYAQLAKLPGKRTLYLQGGRTTQVALDEFKQQAPHWTVVLEGCDVQAPDQTPK